MERKPKLPVCPACGSEMVGPLDRKPKCPKCKKPRRRDGYNIGLAYTPKIPKELLESEGHEPEKPDEPGS